MSEPKKLLLCRPPAGLNDVLCQVAICWDYAIKHNRILVIDTKRASLGVSILKFLLPFPDSGCMIWRDSSAMYRVMDSYQNVFPAELAGKVTGFWPHWRSDLTGWVIKGTDVWITPDFEQEYGENLLIHGQGGGGIRSLTTMSRMAFRPSAARIIGAKVAKLGTGYLSVHVRNTDMKTDYKPFFEQIKPRLEGRRLLICSDDAQCKAFAHKYFDKTEILETSVTPDTQGKRLHGNPNLDPHDQLLSAFIDLMGLAMSEEILLTETSKSKLSGFARLAVALHGERHIRDRLLTSAHGVDRSALGFTTRPAWDAPDRDMIKPDLDLMPVEAG